MGARMCRANHGVQQSAWQSRTRRADDEAVVCLVAMCGWCVFGPAENSTATVRDALHMVEAGGCSRQKFKVKRRCTASCARTNPRRWKTLPRTSLGPSKNRQCTRAWLGWKVGAPPCLSLLLVSAQFCRASSAIATTIVRPAPLSQSIRGRPDRRGEHATPLTNPSCSHSLVCSG